MLDENYDRENSIRAHVIESAPVDKLTGSINLTTININENIDSQRLLQGMCDYCRGRNIEWKTKSAFKGEFHYDPSLTTNKHVSQSERNKYHEYTHEQYQKRYMDPSLIRQTNSG